MISSPLQSINLSISEIGASTKTIASLPDQKSRYHIDQIFVQVFSRGENLCHIYPQKKRGLTVTLFILSTVQLDISLEVYLLLNFKD